MAEQKHGRYRKRLTNDLPYILAEVNRRVSHRRQPTTRIARRRAPDRPRPDLTGSWIKLRPRPGLNQGQKGELWRLVKGVIEGHGEQELAELFADRPFAIWEPADPALREEIEALAVIG